MKITKNILCLIFAVFSLLLSNFTYALALTVAQNQLKIRTSSPKRGGETAFSCMVTWRKGESNLHRANGLVFVNGLDTSKPNTAGDIAKKMYKSLNASINYDAPKDRGALVKQIKDSPKLLIANKVGFDLAQITTRDYSNQELVYRVPNKSFKNAGVDIAIDLVYAADVEYVDGFSTGIKKQANGGWIQIIIGKNKPVEIKTDGKSTQQIEKELATAIGAIARFSNTSIYPNFVERKSRNYKPFDGGEIQLLGLDVDSLIIDVNDSGLGVLAKFRFPDVNKPTDVAGNIVNIIALVIFVLVVFVYLKYFRKKS